MSEKFILNNEKLSGVMLREFNKQWISKNDELQRGFCLLFRFVVKRIRNYVPVCFVSSKSKLSALSYANIFLLRVIAVLGFGDVKNDAEVRLRQMCTSKLFMSSYLKQTSEIDLSQQTFYLEGINQTDETSRQNDVTSNVTCLNRKCGTWSYFKAQGERRKQGQQSETKILFAERYLNRKFVVNVTRGSGWERESGSVRGLLV